MRGGDAVPVKTLSGQDPALAARAAAFLERRNLKKDGGRKKKDFLSNLEEMDADVTYRFTFNVIGDVSKEVVEAVCASKGASKLGSSIGTGASAGAAYRCLCEVAPASGPGSGPRQVAKLALNPLPIGQDAPPCKTRQEGLSTANVYTLSIDTVRDGDSDFKAQLEELEKSLQRLRANVRARCRPVKALLLCCARPEGLEPRSSLERWAVELADFEQVQGEMWKFGPVCIEHGEDLHATFVEMTSARIVHVRKSDADQAGPGEDPADALQQDDDATRQEDVASLLGGTDLFPRSPGGHSETPSTVSERERPPCFEAEMSGSECSETALELHERTFRMVEDLIPASPQSWASPHVDSPAHGEHGGDGLGPCKEVDDQKLLYHIDNAAEGDDHINGQRACWLFC